MGRLLGTLMSPWIRTIIDICKKYQLTRISKESFRTDGGIFLINFVNEILVSDRQNASWLRLRLRQTQTMFIQPK